MYVCQYLYLPSLYTLPGERRKRNNNGTKKKEKEYPTRDKRESYPSNVTKENDHSRGLPRNLEIKPPYF